MRIKFIMIYFLFYKMIIGLRFSVMYFLFYKVKISLRFSASTEIPTSLHEIEDIFLPDFWAVADTY